MFNNLNYMLIFFVEIKQLDINALGSECLDNKKQKQNISDKSGPTYNPGRGFYVPALANGKARLTVVQNSPRKP